MTRAGFPALRMTLLAAVLAGLPVGTAHTADMPQVAVRVGNHPGFGRVVFDLPGQVEYELTQQGQHVIIEFKRDLTIGSAPGAPHNVQNITGGKGHAEFDVTPGTIVRTSRMGDRVVIDVADGSSGQASSGPPSLPASPVPSRASAKQASTQEALATPPATAATPAREAASTPAAVATPVKGAASTPAAAVPPTKGAASTSVVAATPAKRAASTKRPSDKPASPPAQAPAAAVPPALAAAPSLSTSPPAAVPAAPTSPAPVSPQHDSPPALAASTSAAVAAAQPSAAPAAATADDTAVVEDLQSSELIVPFAAPLGVAAFRRGNGAVVVFDQALTLDLSALHDDPVFSTAVVQTLPDATVVQLRLEGGTTLAVSSTQHAWRIGSAAAEPNPRPIPAVAADGRLVLSASSPGKVVALSDPETGATLLVGTLRRDGQSTPMERRTVDFLLLPTWLGVAVVPISDQVAMRPIQDGFVVSGGATGLSLSPSQDIAAQIARAAGLTRQFDFPDQPTPTLLETLRRQRVDSAMTPARARGPRRDALARTMISLGLGAEAAAVLRAAANDDPAQADGPENGALASIAALLAHRPADAAGLDNTKLSEADDVVLWRAVRQAEQHEGSAAAAAALAVTWPLLLGYPAEIRDRVLPLAAETMAAGGETEAAAAVLEARKDDPTLDMARGMVREAMGDATGAIEIYDRLAQSPDRLQHARAAVRAVEVRLARGAIDPHEAAVRLDRLMYAWRGDDRELALRERVAALQAQSGMWRAALAILREDEALFPADKPTRHAKLTNAFTGFLRSDAASSLPPLELVALLEENADLLPDDPDGEALEARLADRLLALDLPNRAGPVLDKLMKAAPTSAGRAGFGARLAAMRQREDDATGALAALAASDAPDLPPDLVERRSLLLAQSQARRGDTKQALAALAPTTTAAADEVRATILERANDWPGAERALADYIAKAVPPEGELDDTQRRTLLRLATAAARAGDDAALVGLREHQATRMGTGPLADMFRLLTSDQVRTVADLKRSGREATLAKGLPDGVKAVKGGEQ